MKQERVRQYQRVLERLPHPVPRERLEVRRVVPVRGEAREEDLVFAGGEELHKNGGGVGKSR